MSYLSLLTIVMVGGGLITLICMEIERRRVKRGLPLETPA